MNPMAVLGRISDNARRVRYHQNQIALLSDEIVGLSDQILRWLKAWDPELEEAEEQLQLPGVWWEDYETP